MLVYSNPRVPLGTSSLVTKGSGISFLEFQVFKPRCKNLVPYYFAKNIFFVDPDRICYPSWESILILCYTGPIDPHLLVNQNNTDFLPALKLSIIIIISPTDQLELILSTAHKIKH